MKLLIATHSLAGLAGAPLHTLDMCRGFRRAEHDVSAFTFYPGVVSDTLEEEGFRVFSLRNYRSLGDEPFDLIYVYHATSEALLGLMFARRVPIIRGYIGKGSTLANPVNGQFSSGATYISEGVRETMNGMYVRNAGIPSLIARNVYDDQQAVRGSALGKPPADAPNLALVSNHAPPELAGLLETAAKKGLCRFTHFGHPHNSTPITPESLAPFDAVITIGRTVLLAAAIGKPVYLCDIHGVEGWLSRESYVESRRHSFSGRLHAIDDWGLVRRQLLDVSQWPSGEDVTWLGEQVERDHALSKRVTELEGFFTDIIEKAPPPVPVPDGYRAVFNLINEKEQDSGIEPGRRRRRQEAINKLKVAEAELEAKDARIRELEDQLRERETQKTRGSKMDGLSKAAVYFRNRLRRR